MRGDGDWVGVVEAAYRTGLDDKAWANGVTEAVRRVFANGAASLISVEFGKAAEPRLLFDGGESYGEDQLSRIIDLSRLDPTAIDVFWFPPSILNTHRSLMRAASPPARAMITAFQERAGIADALGAVLSPVPGESTVLFSGSDHEIALSRYEENAVLRVALHIEAAIRLRRRPDLVKAIVEPNGKVVHLEAGAPAAGKLTEAARGVERARTRRHRRSPEAVELWKTLIDGRASLVERTDGGRRHYLVIENAPERTPMLALTKGELDVVADAARGLSAKLIAYGHGISAPTVSSRLANASSKLGLASRLELVRIAALLGSPTRSPLPSEELTLAEKDVLELLAAGLSNAEIASRRNRSVRTIANQVAKLLAKTGSSTRRALAIRA